MSAMNENTRALSPARGESGAYNKAFSRRVRRKSKAKLCTSHLLQGISIYAYITLLQGIFFARPFGLQALIVRLPVARTIKSPLKELVRGIQKKQNTPPSQFKLLLNQYTPPV